MKYSIIYLDPPWKYNNRANHKTRFRGGVHGHYPTMTMDEIKALPIPDLMSEHCAVLMWCTFPYLDEQIKLFAHWGIKYRTNAFTWIKTNRVNGNPFFGVGHYTKSNAEVCLLGIKGRMKPISNSVSSVIISPRREHSRKPDEARDRIVQLFGNLPRVELFCRHPAPGWDVWGNDVDSTVALPGVETPEKRQEGTRATPTVHTGKHTARHRKAPQRVTQTATGAIQQSLFGGD